MTRTWVRIVVGTIIGIVAMGIGFAQPSKEYIRVNGRVVAIESGSTGDFSISPAGLTVALAQGQSQTVMVTVTPTGGFTGAVTLSVNSGLPTGVTASFSPSSLTLGSGSVTSVLTLTAATTAATGSSTLTLTGTSGTLSRNASVTLAISLPADFSLSNIGNVTMTAGSGAGNQTMNVSVAALPLNGFNSTVALSTNNASMPSGVSLALGAASVGPAGWGTTLTITTTPTANLGTVSITVTGTNGLLTRAVTFQLTVVAQPTFTMSAPASATVVAGLSGAVSVTLAKVGSFNSPVVLSASGGAGGPSLSFSPGTVSTLPGASTMTFNAVSSTTPATFNYTIQGQSSSPAVTRTQAFSLSVIAAQQQLGTATITPSNGSEVTISSTATDPAGAGRIQSVEYSLSTSTGSNTFSSGKACRFRVNRSGSLFVMNISDVWGSSWLSSVKTVGTQDTLSNGVCQILLGQSSVTQSGTNLTMSLRVRNVAMSGTHYLRGVTATNTVGSLPQPYTYLGATWGVPPPPVAVFSNSQGVTPPVVYSSFNVTVTMTGSNLGTNVMTMKLAQANDGMLQLSGSNPLSALYTAGNSGENRDVIIRGLICSGVCAANESNKIQEYAYTIRVLSSTSSPPSLNFTNPFSGSPLNPSPINSTITANGSGTTFINFGIRNTPYAAAQCTYWPVSMCTPIQNLYLNINRTFTESALIQDRANGCQLRINIFSGGSPPAYYFFLRNDAGDYESGFLWTPAYGGGSTIENSQCRLNIQSSLGAYAQWPANDNTTLGIGIQYVFKAPFAGTRYVFMMGHRNSGDWSGWQYRGFLNLQ